MRRFIIIYLLMSAVCVYAQDSKLSPYVRQAMMAYKNMPAASRAKGLYASYAAKIPTITAFVRTTDPDALRQQGCRIYAKWDDIVIASIPLDKLSFLISMPQIHRIEASRSCSLTNDTTATITRARDVWQLRNPSSLTSAGSAQANPSTLTGNGVVVGVMDVGFDLTNPTFYSADGQTYRIKQFWDQLATETEGGEPVIGMTKEGNDTIYVGRQYIGQEALLALRHSYDGLEQYHGTHTTGTAAGSGWEGDNPMGQGGGGLAYSGMAPDADICLVCNKVGDNSKFIPDSLQYLYTSATDMLGFKYIFDYADKVGKPCVINFSEGAYDDLYESGLYSEVLSKMLGPGHILCASAGNEGSSDGTYIHKAEGETGKGAFLTDVVSSTDVYVLKSKKPVKARLSFYKDGVKALDKDYDLTELANFPDSMMIDSVFVTSAGTEQKVDTLVAYFETYPSCFDENLYATDFFLKNTSYDVVPTALTLLGEDNDIEAFGCGSYFIKKDLDPSLADFDHTHNILFPGSSKDVICVGNSAYRTGFWNYAGSWMTPFTTEEKDGVISRYSSVGPAISGLTKPDVVAPGMNIISGYNSFYREENPWSDRSADVQDFTFGSRTYQWHAMSGTSMSTPITAGIVALWLQACPTLTPDQVKNVIAHTATHYDSSLEYPNNSYGWGQIDAMAGVEYIQQTYTGIKEIENAKLKEGNQDAIFTIDGRRVKSLYGRLHGVYIVGGKKVIR